MNATVQASNIEFGVHTPSLEFVETAANGSITVAASAGLNYEIKIDAGLHQNMGPPNFPQARALANGSGAIGYLTYAITKGPAGEEWGDDGLTHWASGVHSVGTGAPQDYTTGGHLYSNAGQIVPPGDYTDIVNITVVF